MKFTCGFTKQNGILDVTITVHLFFSFTKEEFRNNVQPCPTAPYIPLCLHVSTHNVQTCPTVPYISLYVFMTVPIILLRFILS